jgi:hypothetical protein
MCFRLMQRRVIFAGRADQINAANLHDELQRFPSARASFANLSSGPPETRPAVVGRGLPKSRESKTHWSRRRELLNKLSGV